MTAADNTLAERVRGLLAAVDNGDMAELAEFFDDDITFRFGSADRIDGKEAVLSTSEAFLGGLAAVRHEVENLWQVDTDRVVLTMTVHYDRTNGGKLSLPCANTVRFRDNRITEYQIYMDVNPVLA
jgi:ketosteroid isomerase-like protein